jgi:hypothetical protein
MPSVAKRLEADLLAYPGMQADETLVWRTWAALHQTEYDRFDHNIRLGAGIDPGPAFLPEVRKGQILNTQMRLDSVGWRGIDNSLLPALIESPQQVYDVFPSAEAEIIEVKRRATASATGEILNYFHEWESLWPNNPQPTKRIVCASHANTILSTVRATNIILDVIHVNFSKLSGANGT